MNKIGSFCTNHMPGLSADLTNFDLVVPDGQLVITDLGHHLPISNDDLSSEWHYEQFLSWQNIGSNIKFRFQVSNIMNNMDISSFTNRLLLYHGWTKSLQIAMILSSHDIPVTTTVVKEMWFVATDAREYGCCCDGKIWNDDTIHPVDKKIFGTCHPLAPSTGNIYIPFISLWDVKVIKSPGNSTVPVISFIYIIGWMGYDMSSLFMNQV